MTGPIKEENDPQNLTRAAQGQEWSDPRAAQQARAAGSTNVAQGQQQFSQADLNRIVLEYLNKKGYHQTEATLRNEATKIPGAPTIPVSPATTNFQKPETIVSNRSNIHFQQQQYLHQQNASRQRQFDEDPQMFGRAYLLYRSWCENSLEMYKYELEKFLYPIFVQSYLTLIQRGDVNDARSFFEKFHSDHLLSHSYEIRSLAGISLPDHLEENEIARLFKTEKYHVNVSKVSMNLILSFLNENEAIGGGIIVRIINNTMSITTQVEVTSQEEEGNGEHTEGIAAIYQLLNDESHRPKKDTESSEVFNSKAVKLGKLPDDPEFVKELEAELQQKDEAQKDQNPEKTLMEEYEENFKVDPAGEDTPARESLPLPQKTAFDLKREITKIQDSRAKVKLNAVQASLPSTCMYTFHNTNNDMTCVEFNDDSTIVAGGFQDSFIKLWSIDGSPLKSVLRNDPYDQSVDGCRRLIGHSGAVYGLSFSPDNHYLLSSSEDKTVRLWSMDTYTSLVSYKGHNSPVWDVKFSPMGHYFATASHDQTARLWSCDHIYPLRIFAGHLNDVDVVEFHPNSTYLFTGSSDKTVRMWDIARGESVRIFIGHNMPVNALAVSPDGRWLATAGEDSVINMFDIASGRKLKSMRGHGRCSIYSLAFSKDGSVLVSSGSDNSVRVWDVKKGTMESNNPQPEKFTLESVLAAKNGDGGQPADTQDQRYQRRQEEIRKRKEFAATQDHMAVYFTRKTPVYKVHFTRRNLCLAAGVFNG
ncbi:hypothetical protein KL905_001182 [Ogataea polymorpha]|nr:hypothetical protein KL936_000952 [Ogataea polymorpha]KAG7911973.1 hypothetical protein KL906_000177 [Ogataea polymorpha]KAG7913454.1 hypothetical protein KL907_000399 [Ogataea polymorpha]KAG7922916.1 hypothetical protein KL905_001182 [Ogataea polymorpha]KAG7928771.1 hypothetical protein KL925_000952 [Ogataea polymorpha]